MNLWDKILQHTERRVNPHSFATWFRPTRLERAEEDRLVIRVPTRLFCKRLTETYGQLIAGGSHRNWTSAAAARVSLRGNATCAASVAAASSGEA